MGRNRFGIEAVRIFFRRIIGLVRSPEACDQTPGLSTFTHFFQFFARKMRYKVFFMRLFWSLQNAASIHEVPWRFMMKNEFLSFPFGAAKIVFDECCGVAETTGFGVLAVAIGHVNLAILRQ